MSFFKINSLPGFAWPPIPQNNQIWGAYQELDKSQWLSLSEIESNQLLQLNCLLRHCYESSPYYKMIIDKAGLTKPEVLSMAEFRKLPTLSRFEYQNYFQFIKVIKLPEGFIGKPSPIYTSGTTGIPIKVLKTNADDLWWQAFAMRDFEWTQMSPLKRVASIKLLAMSEHEMEASLKGLSTPTWFPFSPFKSSPAHAIDIRLDPKGQLNWLSAINPSYLVSLPSNLDALSNLVKEGSYQFSNLELIQVIGETLSEPVKDNIQNSFGVPVKNLYSSNECGYMASECPEGHGMHVLAENIIAEVLDDNNQPCKPGETGRLVVTSLTNFINPFIRYEIMDYVTVGDGPCPCGRGLPLWKHIEGRLHPMLYLRGGKRKVSTGIMLGIRQIGGVYQFQVIQRSTENFILNVVQDREWTADKCSAMIKCIQNEVEADVNVEVRSYKYLERANGKLKIIIVEGE